MRHTALMIIDVQDALIKQHPEHERSFIRYIQLLLESARAMSMEVMYVRHDDGADCELTKGNPGWEIYEEVHPLPQERIFDKNYNSAFKQTGLQEYLRAHDIQRLIITGLQCEYCIDTTIRVAFEYGYELIVPKGCTSTFNNEYLSGEQLISYYENTLWRDRFAYMPTVEELLQEMKTYDR